MRKLLARRPLLFLAAGLLAACAAAFLLLRRCSAARPGQDPGAASAAETAAAETVAAIVPPEGVSFAVVTSPPESSGEALYAGYSHEADPAHPVLDVPVSLRISNLGARPGAPRPQDLAGEYPAAAAPPEAAPEETAPPEEGTDVQLLTPVGPLLPRLPGAALPAPALPDFYLLTADVSGEHFVGESLTLRWAYTGGRLVSYTVSLSTDGGASFAPLAWELAGTEYTLTFPDQPAAVCVLRVSAVLDGREYKTADTSAFSLSPAPYLAPAPLADYVDPQVQYVDRQGLHISSESGLPVWFLAENHAEGAARLIWQLAGVPFLGTAESFDLSEGILASGELDPAGGEFALDLPGLCAALDAEGAGSVLPFDARQTHDFTLRVVALDGSGQCIGDPGRGICFTYGPAALLSELSSTSLAESSDIQILMEVPVPYTAYQQTWKHIAPDLFDADLGDVSDRVLFSGSTAQASERIRRAVRVELQVATSPFTNFSSLGLAEPQGLVYRALDTAPDIGDSSGNATYLTPWFRGLEYKQFAPPPQELDAMGGIYYYVRGVFYVPREDNPSALQPFPSETLTIAFRVTSAEKNAVQQIAVRSDLPYMQFFDYQPIQWQQSDSEEYFEVARHIEAEEMNFSISKGGEFLLPYAEHISKYGWTREQYQALLDKLLPPGAVIHYVKAQPGFWDEFLGLLKAIYDGVSGAYADAKASVVSLIDYIPLIGDDARAYLKQAATYAIDYGLASIGLPPSLPNIDQLAAGGMDYLMKVAVEEALRTAGVPADSPAAAEISETVRAEVAAGLTSGLEAAILAQRQNPLHADFLRLYTKKLYAPAYVDVFVCNYSQTRPTRSGQLFFSSGNSFDVYRTARVPVPALQPGEHTVIRIYLDHLRNQYDGYNQYFDAKYNGTSGTPYNMLLYADFDLPDVRQAAKAQGLSPAPLPYVTEYVYDHQEYRFERSFVPAEPILTSDSVPNAQDYLD